MLKRHDVTESGLKIDRDWWHAVKWAILIVVAVGVAYFLHVAIH